MNIKIEMGELRVSFENMFDTRDMTNLFKLAFSKSSMEMLGKMYSNIPGVKKKYFEDLSRIHELSKIYEKFEKIRKATEEYKEGPDIFTASGHDIYNYVARYGLATYQIQAVLEFDGRLDFDILEKAVRLSVDAEPIFGCRFVESEPPYWRCRKDLDKVRFCSLEETDGPEAAVQRFTESPLSMDRDPMVKARLIRSAKCDTLCLKMNHTCCDGTGAKEYIKLLSDIYTSLVHDGTFVPEPKKRDRSDQDKLWETLGITDLDAAFEPGSDISTPTWSFPWAPVSSKETCMEICRMSERLFDRMAAFAKENNVTINDLFLTSYYRAMLAMGEPEYGVPMEVPITVDLRRYLPDKKTSAIRNFSGGQNTRLPMLKDESFSGTLSRLAPLMNEIKSGTPGLQSALGLERLGKISYSEILGYYQVTTQFLRGSSQSVAYTGDKCIPTLSNLGYFSKKPFVFGERKAADAYMLPPVVKAPGILVLATTYGRTPILTAGIFKGTTERETLKKLLNGIKKELEEGCRV